MKVLITGAKGFVGQNLIAALEEIRAGHDRRADHAVIFRARLRNSNMKRIREHLRCEPVGLDCQRY